MLPSRRFERSTGLFIALLVTAFLMATFDVRAEGEGVGDTLREGAQTLFSPMQRVADAVTRPVVGFIDGVSNIAGLREENTRLADRVKDLEQQQAEVLSLQTQLAELRKIAGLAPPGDLDAITAQVFSNGVTDLDHIRWIDRGADDGVAVGQAVIDEAGLVGRVDFVADDTARIRLISDPRLGVGVRDLATNETGWVEGQGDNPLRLKMFDAVEPVREGDLVVTDGTRFPPGITVGAVRETAESEAGFQLISSVTPAVDLSEVDLVKVIVGWSPLETTIPGDDQPSRSNPLITER